MEVGRRRTTARNNVVAGSVCENRMKRDEVKGRIKVFNGEENSEGSGRQRNQNKVSGMKKTWKSKFAEEMERSPIQIRKSKCESLESSKEVSVSIDRIEKRPIQVRITRSERHRASDKSCKELRGCVDAIEKRPIQLRKTRSERLRASDESCKELGVSVNGVEESSYQLRKNRSDSHRVSNETPKESRLCREKIISTSLSNVGLIISPQRLMMDDDGEEEKGENEDDTEMEIEKKSFEFKDINILEQKPSNIPEQKPKNVVDDEQTVHHIHEKPIPISANVDKGPALRPVIDQNLTKPQKVLNEEVKIHQMHEKPIPISANENEQPGTVIGHPVIDQSLINPPPIAVSVVFDRIPDTQNKMQNIVDLVMWRDVSRSAFVFGIGTFIFLSSSFTKDVNFSLTSAISYLGLVYLAAVFLHKSIICRGAVELEDSNEIYIVGEEEAIWLLRLILPYLNEFLLKLRGLFSGDPATTMKLAVLLFVLARCGSSITVWKMAKLGFFGVFTVPKVCSSYSTQLTDYGTFWVERFRDAWDSCSHKKAVAATIFTLLWNFSSVVARTWAVFMLVVAVRYYQQSFFSEDWGEEEVGGGEDSSWSEGDKGQ